MKKIAKFLILVSILLILVVPVLSFAVDSLVTCGVTDSGVLASHPNYGQPCDFNQLMNTINTVIDFILFKMVLPIVAIMFAYAGFLLITAGGEAAHARTKAKDIFTNAVIGFVIALAAWLIVSTILSILGYNGSWIGLKV
ncbi:MAG: pilin [bacterium]